MVIALPFSNFGMSVASFWLLGVWFIDQFTSERKNLRYRWAKAVSSPLFWILLAAFFIHVFGLIHTENFKYAFRDLRIKLPLLLFPVVFFTARPIDGSSMRRMWLFLVLACAAAALACLSIPMGIWDRPVYNIRDISVFISHIRFSMLLVFASAVLMLWISERRRVWMCILLLAVNLGFLWVVESITGAVLLVAIVLLYLISSEVSILNRKIRLTLRVALPLLLVIGVGWVGALTYDYFHLPEEDLSLLPEKTAGGELYVHHPENTMRENGEFIWRYIAWSEMANEWNKRSDLAYDGKDERGQELYGTLVRYLTSKGLRKDAEGVAALTQEDIRNIKRGIPSILELEHSGLRRRLDKIFFEISNVQNGGNPGGNSVTQRLEFWKAGMNIIGQRPLFGVGTGDVQDAFDASYEELRSELDPEYRLRAHNQYMTFWIAFGITGFLLLIILLFIPVGVVASERGFLFTGFCLIMALSFLTEDTLETQAGVTFFAFFASLFSAQRLAFHSRIRPNT